MIIQRRYVFFCFLDKILCFSWFVSFSAPGTLSMTIFYFFVLLGKFSSNLFFLACFWPFWISQCIISNTIIKKYLGDKKLKDIDELILACTHYPLIKDEISNYYQSKNANKKTVDVIDSVNIIAKYISENIKNKNIRNNSENKFYVSNYTKSFEESAKLFFKENIFLEEKNLFID